MKVSEYVKGKESVHVLTFVCRAMTQRINAEDSKYIVQHIKILCELKIYMITQFISLPPLL